MYHWHHHIILSLLLCSWIILAFADDCNYAVTCQECLKIPNCMWCQNPPQNFTSPPQSFRMCQGRSSSSYAWEKACGDDNIAGVDSNILITQDLPLSQDHSLSSFGELIQMKPQRVQMTLNNVHASSMNLRFGLMETAGLDLYYLIDLSRSTESSRKRMIRLGQQIAEEIQEINPKSRLGLGFIASCDQCGVPYTFQHALGLTDEVSRFVEVIDKIPASRNVNLTDGGLDAIMQAISCRSIGWRSDTRRLLLFVSSGAFHEPEIWEENVNRCHLNMYDNTDSESLYHRSVNQLNEAVMEEKINIIFVARSKSISTYLELSERIVGSDVRKLSKVRNILQLIRREGDIPMKVMLMDNADHPVSIRYFTTCNSGGAERETSFCPALHVGDVVDFRVEVEVEKCSKHLPSWKDQIMIYPLGFKDTLELDLELRNYCDCNKQDSDNYEEESAYCSYRGINQNGICACNEGYYGRNCECSPDQGCGLETTDDSRCKANNNSLICSGQGSCVNGHCICYERDNPDELISGPLCECTNFMCDYFNGRICSGPDHGRCDCGKCQCNPGWMGDACECEDSHTNCINPESGEICSNNGMCECNQCKCFSTEGGMYSGRYCEDCPICKGKCINYKPCVQCQVFGTGDLTEEECHNQCSRRFNATVVSDLSVEDYDGERLCSFFDENDCRFKFVYGAYDENFLPIVRVRRTLDCPPPPTPPPSSPPSSPPSPPSSVWTTLFNFFSSLYEDGE